MIATITSEYTIGRNGGVLSGLREMTRAVTHNDHEVVAISLREGIYNLYYCHGREYGDYRTTDGGECVEVRL